MTNGEHEGTRYHAEIKGRLNDEEIRVNIFADTLNEIFLDIAKVHNQLFEAYRNPAHREIANAEEIARRMKEEPAPTPPAPTAPVCPNCKTADDMELVKFTDKKTNKPRSAWKCQQCEKWYWPDANGRGK